MIRYNPSSPKQQQYSTLQVPQMRKKSVSNRLDLFSPFLSVQRDRSIRSIPKTDQSVATAGPLSRPTRVTSCCCGDWRPKSVLRQYNIIYRLYEWGTCDTPMETYYPSWYCSPAFLFNIFRIQAVYRTYYFRLRLSFYDPRFSQSSFIILYNINNIYTVDTFHLVLQRVVSRTNQILLLLLLLLCHIVLKI